MAIQGYRFRKYFADPHPGNILILKDNRIAFVDFGIASVPPSNRKPFYKILKLINDKTENYDGKRIGTQMLYLCSDKLAKAIKELDEVLDSKFSETILSRYGELIDQKKATFQEIESENREDFTAVFLNILESGVNFNVKVPNQLFNFIKSTSIFKSYSLFLEPNEHFSREVYSKVLSEVNEAEFSDQDDNLSSVSNIEEALDYVINWVSDIAEADMPFYFKVNSMLNNV